jgi:magnesium-transporting ATPase (P-type)
VKVGRTLLFERDQLDYENGLLPSSADPCDMMLELPVDAFEPGEAWHAKPVGQIFERFSTDAEGLTSVEATKRQAVYGLNRLPAAKPRGALERFFLNFITS